MKLAILTSTAIAAALAVCADTIIATYNFAITNDRGGKDVLLIGPEDEGIHIGVIGRWFYPTESTLSRRDMWPAGTWTTTVSPPEDPPHYEWRYMLDIRTNGTVAFCETEYFQEYDNDFRPVGSNRIQRILALSGSWTMSGRTNGVITFDKKNDNTAANKGVVRTGNPRTARQSAHP
jgi:hypothetical protein